MRILLDGEKLVFDHELLRGLPPVEEESLGDFRRFHHASVDGGNVRERRIATTTLELLKELGKIDKPILLKRGLSSTIEEWLMSAEYIMAGGNNKVILCERGIRTYETATRNTLDLSAVPVIKKKSHLPVIVDPSHATGKSSLVEQMSLAAVAAGADGLMIEVHNDPKHALSDGAQSLTPEQFDIVAKKVFALKKAYDEIMQNS